MTNDFVIDFDIVVINSLKEAFQFSGFFKKSFDVKYRFHKGYYAISFDKQIVEKITHFWDKNTYWRNKRVNTYTANEYIEKMCKLF